MHIIKRTERAIFAIHENTIAVFSIKSLADWPTTWQKAQKKKYCVGTMLNDQLMSQPIWASSNYHDMILKAETAVVISQEQYDKLLKNTVALVQCIEKVDHLHTKLFGKVEDDADSD